MKIKSPIILVLMLCFTLNSCLNRYEEKIVGEYELYKFELRNPKTKVDHFSKLLLKKDKTFELKYDSLVINGQWKADDYGDWTLIELESKNSITKGKILNNALLFENTKIFDFKNFNNMEFTKTKDLE